MTSQKQASLFDLSVYSPKVVRSEKSERTTHDEKREDKSTYPQINMKIYSVAWWIANGIPPHAIRPAKGAIS